MQWPAVSSHRLFTTVAPQKCPPRRVKLAIKGVSPISASLPPTMRLSRCSFDEYCRQGTERAEEKK